MKNIILAATALTVMLTACSNSTSEKKDTTVSAVKPIVSAVDTTVKQTTDTPTKMVTSIETILAGYLQMKNAFTKDNSKQAGAAGEEMVKALAAFNKTSLTPDLAKIYNDIQDDAKEHAEHIGSNAGNIKHQREHFEMLSKDMADLIKTFGNGGQTLYKDFCPMYNNGNGGYWISETKEIKNPYLGKAMPTCGTIKEEMK